MCFTENASVFPHENKICCFVVTLELKWFILIKVYSNRLSRYKFSLFMTITRKNRV